MSKICVHPRCKKPIQAYNKCAKHIGVIRCEKCNRWAFSGGICDLCRGLPRKIPPLEHVRKTDPVMMLAQTVVKVEAMQDVPKDEVQEIVETTVDKIGMLTDVVKVKLEPMDDC